RRNDPQRRGALSRGRGLDVRPFASGGAVVPSIGDRRNVTAELRGGEPFPGASGDRVVGLDCLPSPALAVTEEGPAAATGDRGDEAGGESVAAGDGPFVAEPADPPRGE